MNKVWKIAPKLSDDLITQLLENRGVTTTEEKDQFFNPKILDYEKDLKIPGIKQAQKRIRKAIDEGELIIVYGDYDVDGICASAILYKALSSLGAKVLPYIPHREKEGYGLSNGGLEYARDSGAGVVITVDNGIVALEQAKFAKELGLDLIITDHHTPLEALPEANCIVHSQKMCGAAVGWCLVREIISDSLEKELLQFVAIATICDMLPLLGLGRAFVYEGLKEVNKTKNIGILSLLLECNLSLPLSSYDISHVLGPRLNAIGRLEHAIDALRLLCTRDQIKARKLAKMLADANVARQQLTLQAIDQARTLVDQKKKIHIVDSAEWVPGIIGLVAARLTEEFGRPSIAISVGDGLAKGSARSKDGVNITEIIRTCSDILVDVGGHKGAAGFSIKNEHITIFKQRLEEAMEGVESTFDQVLEIEAQVEANKLTKSLAKELEDFEPFGFFNAQPLLSTNHMQISDIRLVGNEGKHLKFKADGIDAIAFGFGNIKELLSAGQLVDLAYNLEINKFNGAEILQLKIKDIRLN